MLLIPAPGGIYDGRKKQSNEELLFDVKLLKIQQVATWTQASTKSIYHLLPGVAEETVDKPNQSFASNSVEQTR
jgi:hypothetical protein